ncbi:MAG: hypothetical protein ACP5FU_04460 [Nitrososphaeria archaeon]|nr:hypothetical protein [Conexivisphaerales archaeon]
MQVVISDKSTDTLLQELKEALRSEKVIGLARLPEPRPGIRYRDIIKKVFSLAGSVEAIVFIEMEDGEKRVYVFDLEAVIKAGTTLMNSSVKVRGKYLKYKDGLSQVVYYKETSEGKAGEVFEKVNEMADLYEAAYEQAFSRKVSAIDIYYWLE